MLTLSGVSAGYGSFRALFDVSIDVRPHEAVGVIGPNGAGKTTLLRTISGLVPLSAGEMTFQGNSLAGLSAHRILKHGLGHIPENRRLGLRFLSAPEGTPQPARRHAFRWRATDVRDRPRAHVTSQTAADG